MLFHEKSQIFTALYSDRSIYHWYIAQTGSIKKIAAQLFHVGPLFNLEVGLILIILY